jgi:transposase-like protein
MAKIPQGEWSAIAERYSQGESISSIARDYGCTAPAIHYILKRNKERATVSNPRPALAQTLTKPEVSQPARSGGGENGRHSSSLTGRKEPTVQAILPPPKEHHEQMRGLDFAPLMEPVPTEGRPTGALQLQRGKPQRANRASALTARLDAELRADAEVAIQAFRSSFEAALAENSPVTRERLRQTASDLMRAAARTTIVLDRLSAGANRAAQCD